MAWLQIVSSAVQGAGSLSESRSQADMSDINASLARGQAVYNANQQRRETAKLMSAQRAAYGASGVQVNTGTPIEFVGSTGMEGELDALMTIYGGETEARLNEFQSSQLRQQGLFRAGSSILSTAGKMR